MTCEAYQTYGFPAASHLHPSLLIYLTGNGRELHHMEGFIIGRGTWIDVDNHAGLSMPCKETLEHPSQLAVTERHNVLLGPEKEETNNSWTEITNPAPSTSLGSCPTSPQRTCIMYSTISITLLFFAYLSRLLSGARNSLDLLRLLVLAQHSEATP